MEVLVEKQDAVVVCAFGSLQRQSSFSCITGLPKTGVSYNSP